MQALEKEQFAKRRSLMIVAEVCDRLGISSRTFSRIRSKGHFPSPTIVGGRPKWRSEVIEKWIDDGGCESMMVQQQATTRKRKKGRNNG